MPAGTFAGDALWDSAALAVATMIDAKTRYSAVLNRKVVPPFDCPSVRSPYTDTQAVAAKSLALNHGSPHCHVGPGQRDSLSPSPDPSGFYIPAPIARAWVSALSANRSRKAIESSRMPVQLTTRSEVRTPPPWTIRSPSVQQLHGLAAALVLGEAIWAVATQRQVLIIGSDFRTEEPAVKIV